MHEPVEINCPLRSVCPWLASLLTNHKAEFNGLSKTLLVLPISLTLLSISNFIYVSSIGANPKASSTYLKNKGQVEEELKKIGFSNLSIIQPSFLVGNRKDFRIVEVLGIPVMKFLSLFFFGGFKKYTPIKVEIVVNAMIKLASGNNSEQTYLSDRLQELGSN